MKFLRLLFLILFQVTALRAASPPVFTTGSFSASLTTLYSFNSLNSGTPSTSALIQGLDGNYYGTYGGGNVDFPNGVVFKITSSGSFSSLYSFAGGNDGEAPAGEVLSGSDANFYGVTATGGSNDYGTVFQILSTGSNGWRYSFMGGLDGSWPSAGLVNGGDGNFYGTAKWGGTNDCGTIFKISISGSLTPIYSFTGDTDGFAPSSKLVLGSDGALYGTTNQGGANGYGTVFKFIGNSLTTIYQFDGITGGLPYGALVWGNDGNLYGTTSYLGAYGNGGTIYKISPNGDMTILHSFNGTDGFSPGCGLVLGQDGNFYGATGWGGCNLFEITPSGQFTPLYAFSGPDGAYPLSSLMQGGDGAFYGMTAGGGANGGGTIFKMFPVLATFSFSGTSTYQVSASDNPTYSASVAGLDISTIGLNIDSTGLISGTPVASGTFNVIVSASNSSGTTTTMITIIVPPLPGLLAVSATGTVGNAFGYQVSATNHPISYSAALPLGLMIDPNNGWISGVPSQTGTFTGTVSAVNVNGTASTPFTIVVLPSAPVFSSASFSGSLTTLYSFNSLNDGSGTPSTSGLTQGFDGSYYGTYGGGNIDFPNGDVFKITSSGSFSSLYSFSGGSDGETPVGGVVIGDDGNFYGVTATGGINDYGTIFQILSTGSSGWRYSFTSESDGCWPNAGLIKGIDGNFYGTTQWGANGYGTVYKITSSGSLTTVYTFNGGDDGGQPIAGLLSGSDGKLYGTTNLGGVYGYGTVFKISPDNSFTTLYSFDGFSGAAPNACLVWGADGNLYGTTVGGGAYGFGGIYKISTTGQMIILHSFNVADGQGPVAGLVQGIDGNFYGATGWGANNLFEITPSGQFTPLYAFSGPDGAYPLSNLLQGSDGSFYGMTAGGGTAGGGGTIFKMPLVTSTMVLGSAFNYQLSATNNPSYSATVSGVDISSIGLYIDSNGVIRGYPTQSGTFNLVIAARNSFGVNDSMLTIVIIPSNIPVVDTGGQPFLSATGTTDGAFGFQIPAINNPTNYSATLPPGLTIDPLNGLISGVPTTTGTFDVTVTVTNNDGSGSAQLRIITLQGPPVIKTGNMLGMTTLAGIGQIMIPDDLAQGRDGSFYGVYGNLPAWYAPWGETGWDYSNYNLNIYYNTGTFSKGFIFKVTSSGSGGFVHVFTGGDDGENPIGGVVAGSDDKFYGVTNSGPPNNRSMVFQISSIGSNGWRYQFTGGADGDQPQAELMLGIDGNLYGTTSVGGAFGNGTIFKITQSGSLTTLYSFSGATDGKTPLATLLQGHDGTIYGTTSDGGAFGKGTLFKLTSNNSLTTLFSFDGFSGANPSSRLVWGNDGNLYGTTPYGGAFGFGTVFKISPKGQMTILYSFNTTDGANPQSGLIQGSDGCFYGSTEYGGDNNLGTYFRITPKGQLTTIYIGGNYPMASNPASGLIIGNDNYFYGMINRYNYNSVFKAPPVSSIIAFKYNSGALFNYQINATNNPSFYDATNLAAIGLTINSVTGLISGTLAEVNGTFNSVITAVNASGSGTAPLSITVLHLPVITSGSSVTSVDGAAFSYQITANFNPTSYNASGLPSGLFIDQHNGLISGVASAGIYNATVTAINVGGTTSTPLTIVVSGSPPVFNNGGGIGAFTTLYSFSGTNAAASTSSFVQGLDGYYGTYGGNNGLFPNGAVFKIDFSGSMKPVYTFSGGHDGRLPVGGVVAGDSNDFYGATSAGGDFNQGTIFQISSSGSSGWRYSFTGGLDGQSPTGLTRGIDGNFYGTTLWGGSNNLGTIFKIDSSGSFTTLHSFTGGLDGNGSGSLASGSDGTLYGTTSGGGAYGLGTVYKITTDSVFTTLYQFDGLSGSQPFTGLIFGLDGDLYGTTTWGGANGLGTVYKISTNGRMIILHSFNNRDGAYPMDRLVQGSDGNFYGTTWGGNCNFFEITPSGNFTPLYSLHVTDGTNPQSGLIQGSDGCFYGMTSSGGTAGGGGTLFKMIPVLANGAVGGSFNYQMSASNNPTYSATVSGSSLSTIGLMINSSGLISGTPTVSGTFNITVTASNGFGSSSTILTVAFALPPVVSADDLQPILTTLHEFNGTDGADPKGGLITGTDGCFYGTTKSGGLYNDGTVFQITASGSLTSLYSFKGNPDGANPQASLVQGSNGVFYGTTVAGGSNGGGTVYALVSGSDQGHVSGSVTLLHSFPEFSGDGLHPTSGLISGSNGYFYGTTYDGGVNAVGTVYSMAVTGSKSNLSGSIGILHSFDATMTELIYDGRGGDTRYVDGYNPDVALVMGSDGIYYGTTQQGGLRYEYDGNDGDFHGTIYKITQNGLFTSIYTFSSINNSFNLGAPNGPLVQGADGSFYGTSQFLGAFDLGSIYKIASSGSMTALVDFNTSGPYIPAAGLISGNDGCFYGTTTSVGYYPGMPGCVFKVSTSGSLSTLYTFQHQYINGPNYWLNSHGVTPDAPLLLGSDNCFYGTTPIPKFNDLHVGTLAPDKGTVFRLTRPAAVIKTGSTWAYQINASNSPDSYSITGLPSGPTISPTGLISWTPTSSGTYNASLNAINAGGTGTAFITVIVQDPPVISPVNQVFYAAVGSSFQFQISASNSPSSYGSVGSLPDGVVLNPNTGLISGTPTTSGSFNFTISAANLVGSASSNLTIVASQPLKLLSINGQAWPQGSSPSFTTNDQGSPLSLQVTGTNPGGNPIFYSLGTGAPSGASINQTTGLFQWTPALGQAGVSSSNYSIQVIAQDRTNPYLTLTQSFSVTVNHVNSVPLIQSIPSQVAAPGRTVSFTASVTDADVNAGLYPASVLSYSLANGAPGSIGATSGVYAWAVPVNWSGTDFNLTVQVVKTGTGVQTVSRQVPISADVALPVIQNPRYQDVVGNNNGLLSGFNVAFRSTLSVQATGRFGVAKVDFFDTFAGNKTLLGSCTQPTASGTFSVIWPVDLEQPGAHTIEMVATDPYGLVSSISPIVGTITLPIPGPPLISTPSTTTGITSLSQIVITGTAQPNSSIQLYQNGQLYPGGHVDVTGAFSFPLTLSGTGVNSIYAKALNATGISGPSNTLSITLDNSKPSAPLGVTATAISGGKVRLNWGQPASGAANYYQVSRSLSPGTVPDSASLTGNFTVNSTTYVDLPPLTNGTSGTCYYWVNAVGPNGAQGDYSLMVSANPDAVLPTVSLYASVVPGGAIYDPVSGQFGLGSLLVTATASKPLSAVPQLMFTIAGHSMGVNLAPVASNNLTYSGLCQITPTLATGTAVAVLSARDLSGNVGTGVTQGGQMAIRTTGPLITAQGTGIPQYLKLIGTTGALGFPVQLDEPVQKDGDGNFIPPIFYLVNSGSSHVLTSGSLAASSVSQTGSDGRLWQVNFVVTTSSNQLPGYLGLSYLAVDLFGNASSMVYPSSSIAVYSDGVPLPAIPPSPLTAKSGSGGRIFLNWQPVAASAGYNLYRAPITQSGTGTYSQINTNGLISGTTAWTDIPTLLNTSGTYGATSVLLASGTETFESSKALVTAISVSVLPPTVSGAPVGSVSGDGSGINVTWSAVTGQYFYNLFRSDSTGMNAVLVSSSISTPSAVDTTPDTTRPYYYVTVVDSYGNASNPSTLSAAAFSPSALLPVSNFSVVLNQAIQPLLSWSWDSSRGYTGFDLYLVQPSGSSSLTTLTPQPNVYQASYVDLGYNPGMDRVYSLVPFYLSGTTKTTGTPRLITLPQASVSADAGNQMIQGAFNQIGFTVQSGPAQPIQNARVMLSLSGSTNLPPIYSDWFSLPVNSGTDVMVTVPGYSLGATAGATLSLVSIPQAGETVTISNSYTLPVLQGGPTVQIMASNLYKGALASVQFSVTNPGNEPVELLFAGPGGQSASTDIRFKLLDQNGAVLALVPFTQINQSGTTGQSGSILSTSRGTFLTLPSKGSFTTASIPIQIPLTAPDSVYVQLEIDNVYSADGSLTSLPLGLSTKRSFATMQTAYSGVITNVTFNNQSIANGSAITVTSSNQAVTLSGSASYRVNNTTPPANVPLVLGVSVNGFERDYNLNTQKDGTFSFTFQPDPNERGGIYSVWIRHPDVQDTTPQQTFVLSRVTSQYGLYQLVATNNVQQSLPLRVYTGHETTVQNVKLVCTGTTATGAFGSPLPAGITINSGTIPNLAQDSTVMTQIYFTYTGPQISQPIAGKCFFQLVSDENPTGWQSIELDYQVVNASPVWQISPPYVDAAIQVSGSFTNSDTETVTLTNVGQAQMQDVTVSLQGATNWMNIISSGTLGSIAPGESSIVTLYFNPQFGRVPVPQAFTANLLIQSSNAPQKQIVVMANTIDSGNGSALIHVGDIYTDGTSNLGLAGATVVIQSEFTNPTNPLAGVITFSNTTDAFGQVSFGTGNTGDNVTALPVGWYDVRVSGSNHNSTTSRIYVKPGQTASLDVFLPYSVISLTWSVVPVLLQDEYNIVLNATYQTKVPAPVVVIDPPSFNLPDMNKGDVFNGQVTLTNVGLIAANSVTFTPPANDAYFKYELLNSVPTSLDAGQIVVVAYRVTCLTPLGASAAPLAQSSLMPSKVAAAPSPQSPNMPSSASISILGNWQWLKTLSPSSWKKLEHLAAGNQSLYRTVQNSPATGSSGCWTYSNCMTEKHLVHCQWNSSLDYWATNYFCTAKSGGTCPSAPGPGGGGGGGGGGTSVWQFIGSPSGGGPTVLPPGQSIPTVAGQLCFPPPPECQSAPPPCPDGKCQKPEDGPSCGGAANLPAKSSWVNLPSREYRDYVEDLRLEVPGGSVAIGRQYTSKPGTSGTALWKWNCLDFGIGITAQSNSQYLVCALTRGLTRFTPFQSCPSAGAPALTGSANQDSYSVFYNDWQLKTEKIVVTYGTNSISNLRWSDNAGHWCLYDATGKLTDAGTRDLTLAHYNYDPQQRLQTITTGSGTVVSGSFAYTTTSQLAAVSDALGRRVSYGYTNGLLTSCTTSLSGSSRLSSSYSYDAQGRILSKTTEKGQFAIAYDKAGYIQSITDAGGGVSTFNFDYDSNNLIYYSRIIDADGKGTERYFDQLGRLTMEKIDGTTMQTIVYNGFNQTITDDKGRITQQIYDENGNLISETLPDGSNTTSIYDPASGQILQKTDPLGKITKYEYDSSNNLSKVTDGLGLPLAAVTTYTSYDQHRPTHQVDPSGIITDTTYTPSSAGGVTVAVSVTGTDGSVQQTSRVYDPAGNLISSTDALSHQTSTTRDFYGRVLSETNVDAGLSTLYTYDPTSGDLVRVESGRLGNVAGRVTTYTYDAMHRRLTTNVTDDAGIQIVQQRLAYSAAGRLLTETDALGNVTSYGYDKHGNQLYVQRNGLDVVSNTYDSEDHLVEVDTPTGAFGTFVTTMTYDFAGRVLTRTSGTDSDSRTVTSQYQPGGLLGSTIYTGSGGTFTTQYGYDLFGRRVSVNGDVELSSTTQFNAAGQVVSLTDGNGNQTFYGYDAFGRPSTQTRGSGSEASTTQTFYDANGNVLQTVDGAGNRQYFKYDVLGRRTDQSVPTTDPLAAGWELIPQNVLSHVTYDAWGGVLNTVDAVGGSTSSIFDSLGRMSQSTDKNGLTLVYHYDNLGRVSSVTYPAVSTASSSGSTAIVYQYDPNRPDWLLSVTDRAGNTTQTTYDSPSGLKLTESTSLGGTTHYSYDSLGRIASATDPYSNTTRYSYDQFDRVTQTLYPDQSTESNSYDNFGHLHTQSGAGQYALTYGYDFAGNMISMTDGNQSLTQWAYDSQNRMKTKTYADGKFYAYTYYGNGTIQTRTDGNGAVTYYYYNSYGLLSTITYPNDPSVNFNYDALGRMVLMTDAIGTTGYTYSTGGLLLSCTQNAVGRVVGYGYDVEGHRTSRSVGPVDGVADPGGNPWQTSYNYDSSGRLEKIYDARVSVNPFQYVWKSGANLVDHLNLPGALVQQQKSYDQGGRLQSISLQNTQTSGTLNSFGYGYNTLSQRNLEQSKIAGNRGFKYDAQWQLKEVDALNPQLMMTSSSTYSYDPIGNWLTQTGNNPLTFVPNNLNQYTSIVGAGGTQVPQYDHNGSMTNDGNGMTFTWDDENRLKSVTKGANQVQFSYNGLGWRVEKRVYDASVSTLQKSTRFVYDGVNLIEELDYSQFNQSPSLIRSYTLGLDLSQTFDGAGGVGGLLAAKDYTNQNAGIYYYSYDGNGNVTDLVDGLGVSQAHYEYSAFGTLVNKTGNYAEINPFRWSAKYQDIETGLAYYGYRFYYSNIGRWISRDPIEEGGGVNVYAYVGNTPVSYFDPLGLWNYEKGPSERVQQRRAIVIADQGDTIRGLASFVKLEPDEYRKWLKGMDRGLDEPLPAGCKGSVPNVMKFFKGNIDGKWYDFTEISDNLMIIVFDNIRLAFKDRVQKKGFFFDGPVKAEELIHGLGMDADTIGMGYMGHGGEGMITTESNELFGPSSVKLTFKPALLYLYSCHAGQAIAAPNPNLNGPARTVSTWNGLISKYGTVYADDLYLHGINPNLTPHPPSYVTDPSNNFQF